jgi:hypothetical protein
LREGCEGNYIPSFFLSSFGFHSRVFNGAYSAVRKTMLFIAYERIVGEYTFHRESGGSRQNTREFYANWIGEFNVTRRHYILLRHK